MPQPVVILPTSKVMAGLVELCGGDPVAWEYATKQLLDKLDQAGITDKPDAQKVYGKFVACHAAAVARSEYNTVENAVNNPSFEAKDPSQVTEVQGEQAAQDLHDMLDADQQVNIIIAVSHMAQLLRGYQSDGKQLSEEEGKPFDQLMNEFLVKNGYVSSGGDEHGSNIFQCEDGQVKKDAQGRGIKADPVLVKQLLEEKLPAFMKEKKLNVEVKGVNHPSTPKAAQQQETTATQEGPASETSQKQKQEQVAESQESTTPGSKGGN